MMLDNVRNGFEGTLVDDLLGVLRQIDEIMAATRHDDQQLARDLRDAEDSSAG